MARMTPPAPAQWQPGWRADRHLFDALQSGLGDDWHVFHDYAYLGRERPAAGAIDFLAVHREHGLLAIACPGEGVRLRGDGTWMRLLPDGREEPLGENPFRRVQRQLAELVAEMQPKLGRLAADLGGAFPFAHGYAVAFPSARADRLGPLPAEVSPAILIDSADLGDIGRRVREILEYWGRGQARGRALDEGEFRQVREHVLLPRWRLAPSFGARLDLESQAIVRLSAEQAEVLRSLVSGPRLLVRGGAGTGKTVLALEVARAAALEGKRVLLTCFNIALARWIAGVVAAWGPLGERVEVATFHELCADAARACGGLPAAPPAGDKAAADAYWDGALPERLRAAVAAGLAPRFDAVVVDEGQDFRRDWFDLLEGLLGEPGGGTLVIFHDPAQDIFGTGCRLPDFPVATLGVNFRNTRAIASYLAGLVPGAAAPFSRSPDGEPPVFHPSPRGPSSTVRALDRLIDELVNERSVPPGRITVISPHPKESGCLKGVERLGGQALSTDPLERDGAVLCTTIRRFKGLESDVAILVDVREGDLFGAPAFLYTAAARARVLLHVFPAA